MMTAEREFYLNDFTNRCGDFLALPLLRPFDMHVLFDGDTAFLSECALRNFLRQVVCHGQTLGGTSFNISDIAPATHTARYIRVAISNLNFNDVFKYICGTSRTQHVLQLRHLFVIDHLDSLSPMNQRFMAAIMDDATVSIVATTVAHRLLAPLRDRFGVVRVPSPTDRRVQEVFLEYARSMGLDAESYAGVPKRLNYNLRHCLIALALPPATAELIRAPHSVERYIKAFVATVSKLVSIPSILNATRECFNTLMKYNADNGTICRHLWEVLSKKHAKSPDMLFELVPLLARLDVDVRNASKPITHYERFVVAYLDLQHR